MSRAKKPAKAAAATGGVAALVYAIANHDWPLTAITAVGFVLAHGGVRGVLLRLWRGE